MTATTTPESRLTAYASRAIKAEDDARAKLAAELTDPKKSVRPEAMAEVLAAAADAKPWRELLEMAKGIDITNATVMLRESFTYQLITAGYSMSASLIVTQADHMGLEGLRKFLWRTEPIVDEF